MTRRSSCYPPTWCTKKVSTPQVFQVCKTPLLPELSKSSLLFWRRNSMSSSTLRDCSSCHSCSQRRYLHKVKSYLLFWKRSSLSSSSFRDYPSCFSCSKRRYLQKVKSYLLFWKRSSRSSSSFRDYPSCHSCSTAHSWHVSQFLQPCSYQLIHILKGKYQCKVPGNSWTINRCCGSRIRGQMLFVPRSGSGNRNGGKIRIWDKHHVSYNILGYKYNYLNSVFQIRIRCLLDPWIRDRKFRIRDLHPGSKTLSIQPTVYPELTTMSVESF